MTYNAGILNKRITIQKRQATTPGKAGYNSGGIQFADSFKIWANVTFTKGIQSMREGAMDAYDTVMIRAHYHPDIDRRCRIKYKEKVYGIKSFNADEQDNIIQITAAEITNP
jgi:SPP1 family predicted phage head-tail adaptor